MTNTVGGVPADNPGRWPARVWQYLATSLTSAALLDEESAARLRRIRFVGALGVLGHPLYFVIWSVVFPQPYENVWLRAVCTLLFIPLLFANALLNSLSRGIVQILDEQSAGMLAESIEKKRHA